MTASRRSSARRSAGRAGSRSRGPTAPRPRSRSRSARSALPRSRRRSIPSSLSGPRPRTRASPPELVFDETDLGNEDEHLTEDEIEAEEEAEEELAARGEDGFEPRGRRGAHPEAHKDRPRVVQFLVAVWAELQRVQWPDRQALTTLTGVVLGFVLIMGGYLGLLDAIFSEVIKAIL